MPQLISNASHVHGINAKYTHCPLNRRFNDIYYYEYKIGKAYICQVKHIDNS